MYDPIASLDKTFTEIGVAAKWEAKGEAKGKAEVARNMVALGLPFETIVSATQLDPETVKALYS